MAPAPSQDCFFETTLGKLHARVAGQGPAVILLHGSHPANDWRVWEHNLQTIGDAGRRALALDLLGYGQSDRRLEDVSEDEQRQAIVELLEIEKLPSATLMGVSWGGMLALGLALDFPEQVERLILVDAANRFNEDDLARVRCPTLVVWGVDDTVIPLENGRRLAEAIPGARLETIPDVTKAPGASSWSGHHPMRFRPEAFNPILRAFLLEGS
jgi:pimeloyl-ACP methyl ester carboxylesterase